jgi:hypothetical protein
LIDIGKSNRKEIEVTIHKDAEKGISSDKDMNINQ